MAAAALLVAATPAADGKAEEEPVLLPEYRTSVNEERSRSLVPGDRASSTVRRSDMERRLPRSAPDALRFEPGVFVQQTAHGQGSAFIRGLTGQQTLLMFDGIRLNTGTFRQGPNQYFFTIDHRSIDHIEVIRGGASTWFGSDALGGTLVAFPSEAPRGDRLRLTPRVTAFGATADASFGGRVQLDAVPAQGWGFTGGVGGQRTGLLEGGGILRNPADGQPARTPRMARDGRTQLGTGYADVTADGRLSHELAGGQATLAAYAYRQYDTPRTDLCPHWEEQHDACLRYEEQFRTLVYGLWEGDLGARGSSLRATLSWQQQHERRRRDQPDVLRSVTTGIDDVDTLGGSVRLSSAPVPLADALSLQLHGGADGYHDTVDSRAWISIFDQAPIRYSRGQYLDGTYFTGGIWTSADLDVGDFTVRAGGRASAVRARTREDPASCSKAVNASWFPLVASGGLTWRALPSVSVHANLDTSFRAPNLDDLTGRQATGQGFQRENPDLRPETVRTWELGSTLRTYPVELDLWAYRADLDALMSRRFVVLEPCPGERPSAVRTPVALVNAGARSHIDGVEGSVKLRLPLRLTLVGSIAWARGEGPFLGDAVAGATPDRVPLSRIPPLNGTVELDWRDPSGFSAGAAVRWAGEQARLAVADTADARIPIGGTPGFSVLDLRAGFRVGDRVIASLVLENVLDAAYRYHGSAVNGPGRGIIVQVQAAPF